MTGEERRVECEMGLAISIVADVDAKYFSVIIAMKSDLYQKGFLELETAKDERYIQ